MTDSDPVCRTNATSEVKAAFQRLGKVHRRQPIDRFPIVLTVKVAIDPSLETTWSISIDQGLWDGFPSMITVLQDVYVPFLVGLVQSVYFPGSGFFSEIKVPRGNAFEQLEFVPKRRRSSTSRSSPRAVFSENSTQIGNLSGGVCSMEPSLRLLT